MSKQWTPDEVDALPVGPWRRVEHWPNRTAFATEGMLHERGFGILPRVSVEAPLVRLRPFDNDEALAVMDSKGDAYRLGQWDDTGEWFKERL